MRERQRERQSERETESETEKGENWWHWCQLDQIECKSGVNKSVK